MPDGNQTDHSRCRRLQCHFRQSTLSASDIELRFLAGLDFLVDGSFIGRAIGLELLLRFAKLLVGVSNLVVVQTKDALLITTRERSQDVGKVVAELKNAGRDDLI